MSVLHLISFRYDFHSNRPTVFSAEIACKQIYLDFYIFLLQVFNYNFIMYTDFSLPWL